MDTNGDIEEITERYSSYDKLLRITALLMRWKVRKLGTISVEEIERAELKITTLIQKKYFKEEIEKVRKGREVKPELKGLSPFIDSDGILRVLGRLQHFNELPYSQRHPAILPSMFQKSEEKTKKINFIQRYLEKIHQELIHGGPKIVTAHVRTKFWVISITKAIKQVISQCYTCFQQKPDEIHQQMAPLQRESITMSVAFYDVIADMAGPFEIKAESIRAAKHYKSYVILFGCKHTKCIHLELVTSASTHNFLNALKRFTARRGLCRTLQVDNGSNFKGAANLLEKEFRRMLQSDEEQIMTELAKNRINIRFISPYSPHLNGAIERAVQSFKFHFKRIFDYSPTLTYEEAQTLVIEIEGILNSKPLTAQSEDPTSFAYLSPAHLAIFRPIKPIVEGRIEEKNPKTRYDILRKVSEKFWDHYKREMFSQSQIRNKWQKIKPNLKVGQLVLIKSTLEPKRFYKRGRIIMIHPGIDGMVRHATYILASGKEEKRHCKDLILLPMEKDEIDINNDQASPIVTTKDSKNLQTRKSTTVASSRNKERSRKNKIKQDKNPHKSHTNDMSSQVPSEINIRITDVQDTVDGQQLPTKQGSKGKKTVQWKDQQPIPTKPLRRSPRFINLVEAANNASRSTYNVSTLTKAASVAFIVSIILCVVGAVAGKSVPDLTYYNDETIKLREVPAGVIMAQTSTLHQFKRSLALTIDTNINLDHIESTISNFPRTMTTFCKIIEPHEKLFQTCTRFETSIHNKTSDLLELIRDLQGKAISHTSLTETLMRERLNRQLTDVKVTIKQNRDMNKALNFAEIILHEIEMHLNQFPQDSSNEDEAIFAYLDLLHIKFNEYAHALNTTLQNAQNLIFPTQKIYDEVTKALTEDERIYPSTFADELSRLTHWFFIDENGSLSLEIRMMACNKIKHIEWKIVSIADEGNFQVKIPNETIVINEKTREFFFPTHSLKRQELKDNTEIFYGNIKYEKETRNCIYNWLRKSAKKQHCEWMYSDPSSLGRLVKLGPSSYLRTGNGASFDVTQCNKRFPLNFPVHNYYYELSTDCQKFSPPLQTQKYFLKAQFPHLIGLDISRNEYKSQTLFEILDESIETSDSLAARVMIDQATQEGSEQKRIHRASVLTNLESILEHPIMKGTSNFINEQKENVINKTKLLSEAINNVTSDKKVTEITNKIHTITENGATMLKEEAVKQLDKAVNVTCQVLKSTKNAIEGAATSVSNDIKNQAEYTLRDIERFGHEVVNMPNSVTTQIKIVINDTVKAIKDLFISLWVKFIKGLDIILKICFGLLVILVSFLVLRFLIIVFLTCRLCYPNTRMVHYAWPSMYCRHTPR